MHIEIDIPKNSSPQSIAIFSRNITNNLYADANMMTGTDIRKENFAASSRFIPRNKPAVIVTPDLDVPGIRANTCARPIINA